jgi:hypothetical protein
MLFLLKVAITPFLVAGVSIAARWWGPTIGGILMGLPWFTGPLLFVLTWDKGIDFGVGACVGIELAVICVGVFILAYGYMARFTRWPAALSTAVILFFASALAVQIAAPHVLPADDAWRLSTAAVMGFAGLAFTLLLLPRPKAPPALQSLPWWDIPMRMVATGTLVATIVTAADVLGPQLSGILGTYPVILTVVCAFTHHSWGADAVLRVLRGVTISLFSFVVFFLVVGTLLPIAGLVLSYACAVLIAVTMTSAMLFLNRARSVR